MFQALVVGNGESRKHLDLNKFKPTHTLIGCNAVHRDIEVNHLICCDRRMVSEALTNPNNKDTIIYVRDSFYNFFKKNSKNISHLPPIPKIGELKRDQPDHWGSGSYAILLAAVLGYQKIDLIGFDLYPIDHKVNNMYKDSNNYSKSNSQGVDPAYWIYHTTEIFINYPTINFTIYNHPEWPIPQDWQKTNVQFKNIAQLGVDSINSSVVQ
jgi:hypothetical protein